MVKDVRLQKAGMPAMTLEYAINKSGTNIRIIKSDN